MLSELKKRKISSKTSDFKFNGYFENNVAYMFLVLKSDVLDYNTIIETKTYKILWTHLSIKWKDFSCTC